MENEHTLDGTQIKYGYIWWSRMQQEHYKKVFPDGDFTVELENKQISRKTKVDWSRRRVYVGRKAMQEIFRKGEPIIISRQSNGIVTVHKSDGPAHFSGLNNDTIIHLSSDVIGILKISGKEYITVVKLINFYEMQGQNYSADDLKKALCFIPIPPILILQKEGEEFKLTVNLQRLSTKIGLLAEIYSRFSKSL